MEGGATGGERKGDGAGKGRQWWLKEDVCVLDGWGIRKEEERGNGGLSGAGKRGIWREGERGNGGLRGAGKRGIWREGKRNNGGLSGAGSKEEGGKGQRDGWDREEGDWSEG
eukprot:294030-Chlamydomonas_euryale.AAC.1